jgi:two-component system response regulator NreC
VRILLVDNNALFLASAQRFLANFADVESVDTARGGREALDQLQHHSGPERPDVVLVDVNMPGMNGFEATQRIKALAPDIRVIMVSLHDVAELRTAAVRAGAENFVAKQDFAATLPALLKINGARDVRAARLDPGSEPERLRADRRD